MLYMNEKMLDVIYKKKSAVNNEKLDAIIEEIVKYSILKNDCVLYDNSGKIQNSLICEDWIKECFSDFVGYESTINELRYDKELFFDSNVFYLVNKLSNELESKFSRKIVLYLTLHDSDFEIRFHSFRLDENDWLDSDLDSYENPIMCKK